MREVRFVYISPDGVDTISIDVDEDGDQDHQMVVVEFILDDLRQRGLDNLANYLHRNIN